ncbi:MAG: helix-turn-helix domain-containing protein [Firmicutes bacterium]|nr:helix-turn-helix domain-containing protein [Bacillota bacterium]
MNAQRLVPAVDRVLNILELLASEQGELSFSELSSSLNIPPSLRFQDCSLIYSKGAILATIL